MPLTPASAIVDSSGSSAERLVGHRKASSVSWQRATVEAEGVRRLGGPRERLADAADHRERMRRSAQQQVELALVERATRRIVLGRRAR
jgi:hypothetical protein